MDSAAAAVRSPIAEVWRLLAWLMGGVAAGLAAIVAAGLAIVLAVAVTLTALMTGALIGLGGLAWRSRRAVRPRAASEVIEARNVGGHSWVAYGWDKRAR